MSAEQRVDDSATLEAASPRAAASRIALIKSVGKLSGFAAPYITGWLSDFTGQQRAGLWVVGGTMVAAAVVTLVFRAAPEPSSPRSG